MAVADAGARVARCEAAMRDLVVSWRLKPTVDALMPVFYTFEALKNS